MLTLFEHPLSPYAQKVKIALYEKNIAFEATTPDIFGGTDAGFTSASPRREVPTLVDGDVAIFDSTIILEYLEDKWPQPAMLPATPAARARVRMLEELCDTYFEAINWGLAEIRVFGRAKGAVAEQMIARAGEQIGKMHARLERDLGARDFFNGDAFGWGDLAVYPYLSGSATWGYPPPPTSRLAGWLARVSGRESVTKCAEAAMAALGGFQNLEPIVEQGLFKREYRDHRLEWMLRSGGTQVVLDGVAKGNIRFSVELD
jgi:glutathione S-transferase